jgi:hypothetical protein
MDQTSKIIGQRRAGRSRSLLLCQFTQATHCGPRDQSIVRLAAVIHVHPNSGH